MIHDCLHSFRKQYCTCIKEVLVHISHIKKIYIYIRQINHYCLAVNKHVGKIDCWVSDALFCYHGMHSVTTDLLLYMFVNHKT